MAYFSRYSSIAVLAVLAACQSNVDLGDDDVGDQLLTPAQIQHRSIVASSEATSASATGTDEAASAKSNSDPTASFIEDSGRGDTNEETDNPGLRYIPDDRLDNVKFPVVSTGMGGGGPTCMQSDCPATAGGKVTDPAGSQNFGIQSIGHAADLADQMLQVDQTGQIPSNHGLSLQ